MGLYICTYYFDFSDKSKSQTSKYFYDKTFELIIFWFKCVSCGFMH